MLRIRLRRTGAKKQPRYRVVVADIRAPRDGAFVDSIGYYDPLTEPSTISIDRDSALDWIAKGAQPSDVVQRLLRTAGIVEGPPPVYPEKKKAAPEKAPAPAAAQAAPVAQAPAATAPASEAPAAKPVAAEAPADADPDATVLVEPAPTAEDPDATIVVQVADGDGTSADK